MYWLLEMFLYLFPALLAGGASPLQQKPGLFNIRKTIMPFVACGYAMLMSPNKDETAVHGCHCQGDMAVRMRKVLARPRGWCLSVSLAFFVFYFFLRLHGREFCS